MTRSQSCKGYSHVERVGPAMPALLTRMSMTPNWASVSWTACSTLAGSVTSTEKIASNACPSLELRRESVFKSHTATAAPAPASRCRDSQTNALCATGDNCSATFEIILDHLCIP